MEDNLVFTPNVILGRKVGDYIAGANIDTPEVVNETGDWTNYPAEHERQNIDFETSACTCFSGNDSREPLMMFKAHNGDIPSEHSKWLKDNGYFKNGFINFDDRVPAMHSEITLGVGTYLWKAAEALRKWSLPQDILPKANTIADWYDKSKLTQEAINLQAEFDKRFKWVWFWVNSLDEGLKYSPVVGTVSFLNGETILCPNFPHNHAVVALQAKSNYVLIDDSYNQQFKKYCLPGFANYLSWKLIIVQDTNMNKSKWLKEHDMFQVRNKDNGSYGVVYGGQLLAVKQDRAGLYMIDRYNRKLLTRADLFVQVDDNEWNTLWRPDANTEGRYF